MNPCLLKSVAVGVVLLSTSMGVAGVSLGRLQGAAWVGQSLDVQIPAQLDHNDDAQPECLSADVQYGETLLDPARITVSWVAATARTGGSGQGVRVAATVLIDEPIVTVNLRVGCQQKLFKRYVLFADVPTSVVEPPVQTEQAVAKAVTPTVLAAAASVGGRAEPHGPTKPAKVAAQAPASGAKAPTPRLVKPRTEPVAVAAPPAPVRASKPQRATAKARLKLDPLDLLIDYAPVLRSSDEMVSVPPEDTQKRSEAAALWRSLNANPQELLQDELRLQRLQKDLQSLHAVTADNQKGLLELADKARQAESERYANGLVYSLIALWVVSLLVLFWVWRRMRAQDVSNWSEGLDYGDESVMPDILPDHLVSPFGPESPVVSAPAPAAVHPVAALPVTEVDLDLGLMESSESALMPVGAIYSPPAAAAPPPVRDSRLSPAAARAVGHVDFQLSISPGARAIDSAELVDARQQADFFMSLGQHEEAIEILTTRIAQVGESSPLVCLDLLKIYHRLGRKSEFEFMRTEFNHWFAARVPEFSEFGNDGRSLERYPQIMERIVSLWPSPEVLEYIEGCIYQHAEEGDGEVFDLQAYLDLLFLHGVAKRLVRQTDDDDDPGTAELLRIPPRPQAVNAAGQLREAQASASSTHRAGAHLRGSRAQRDPVDEIDPELDVDTQGAPLSAIRVPPSAGLPKSGPAPAAASGDSANGNLTDFNFLGLR